MIFVGSIIVIIIITILALCKASSKADGKMEEFYNNEDKDN